VAHPELSLLLLIAVAAAVAVLSDRARLPYAIGLVLAGLLLGNLLALPGPHLSKELLFLVVLPGLLFEAAYQMHFGEFWRSLPSILTLAVPGMVIAALLTALLVWWGVNLWWPGAVNFPAALVFGALISATDPISVLAIFRTLGVHTRLAVIVEAESLFNDGTAVVLYTIVLALAAGGAFTVSGAALEFVRVAGLAVLVGAAVGGAVSLLTRAIDDPMIAITLTVLSAYGAFITADLLGFSGVIACVIAGLVTGGWGAQVGMGPAVRVAVEAFWTYAAFLLNSLVFLLMGMAIKLVTLVHYLPQILLAWLAINLARATVVYSQYAWAHLAGRGAFPWSWAAVLTWGGLRGALSMVLALALPADFAHRELILHITFGVVLLTLLVQGLTMKPLLRWLGMAHAGHAAR
jgi:CPA1 family monovalent cation:H+ antiporter